jgi:predicted HicB family RNase H-like nuclease
MAQKQPAAAEPGPALKAKPSKVDDGKMTTSLRIRPELLSELKVLAVQRRCRVNDVVVEAIENLLALNGRKTAA